MFKKEVAQFIMDLWGLIAVLSMLAFGFFDRQIWTTFDSDYGSWESFARVVVLVGFHLGGAFGFLKMLYRITGYDQEV